MKLTQLAACIAASSLLIACGSDDDNDSNESYSNPQVQKVLNTNADIALAAYSDSVDTAVKLKDALETFKNEPTAANLAAAKTAWLVAREPYGQTEVYRFRNSPIDSTNYSDEDGPEGAINAWPLGEALIDYVTLGTEQAQGDFTTTQIGVDGNSAGVNEENPVELEFDDGTKQTFDGPVDTNNASTKANPGTINIIQSDIEITKALLENTATIPSEADVIAGYHAIEFLLWGQDLNDAAGITDGSDRESAVKSHGAPNVAAGGQRPLTDFTTDADAQRRLNYLIVAADKLVEDLTQVRDGWAEGAVYRTKFTTINSQADANQRLAEILTGMGTLSEGELAGERMQIAYTGNSQEDEHSCFSDNTHRDIVLNASGVENSYYGTYVGYDSDLDGDIDADDNTTRAVNGYGLDDLLADTQRSALAAEMHAALQATKTAYTKIDQSARDGKPFDVLIMPEYHTDENKADNPVRQTIAALFAQSIKIQDIADALSLGDVVDEGASECNTQNPDSEC